MQYQTLFKQIIWPYRPDILIRVDFLAWLEDYNSKSEIECYNDLKTVSDIINCNLFFTEAKKHPYFLQFTRKRRYRKLNLSIENSEIIYAEGILSFIKLFKNIKSNGFDFSNKIELHRSYFLKSPIYGKKIILDYYMGDGCHRLACLIFLNNNLEIPWNCFKIKNHIVYRPVNSFGIFKRIGVFDNDDEIQFDEIYDKEPFRCLKKSLKWIKDVRLKFQKKDIEQMFNIKFYN